MTRKPVRSRRWVAVSATGRVPGPPVRRRDCTHTHLLGGSMKHPSSRRALHLAGAVSVVLAVVAAAASADVTPPASSQIDACVKKSGTLRIVAAATSCKRSERLLSWGTGGQAGPAGPPGPAGPTG